MNITSIHNEKVKLWLRLQEKKYRDETGCYIVEGDHLIAEALKAHKVKEIISLTPSAFSPSYVVTPEILRKLSKQNSGTTCMAVCYKNDERPCQGGVAVLDGVQDPGNLGTILRSALAFGIDTVCLGLDCVDLYNPKVIRSTEGMHFHLNVIRRDLDTFLPLLKKEGYTISRRTVSKYRKLLNIPSSYKRKESNK